MLTQSATGDKMRNTRRRAAGNGFSIRISLLGKAIDLTVTISNTRLNNKSNQR